MKKSIKIFLICILAAALVAAGVIYLVRQTRNDELLIGQERAEQIALSDASLAENQVTKMKTRLKFDDGVWYYDVEFRTIALEYEYEIEAYTGAIIDKDIDD